MKVILFNLLIVYNLWIFYLAVMNLKRAKDTVGLSTPAKVFGYPVLFLGWALDFLANVFPFTIFMLDLPKELTVTARLNRYMREDTGWRKRFTMWFAKSLLDDFDPSGKHVKG